jgi:two-component system, chemotaxis family, protein-glutamate methylesterase/glutaminase
MAETLGSSESEPAGQNAAAPARRTGSQRDIVVIGASAGGVEALISVFAGLPAELPAAVFVVLHVMPGGASVLPKIIGRSGVLPALPASDGDPIERGRVYVAPPDRHMLVRDDHVLLTGGPRENGHRPAVDPLFRSAARAFGPRVIGVVLSGALDDGTAGLRLIADAGGIALVQDPHDALYPSMPASALAHIEAARAVPLDELPDAVCAALEETFAPVDAPAPEVVKSPPVAEPDRSDDDPKTGELTALTCPECGGTLWEHDDEGLLRFKCHVGHAYSADSLQVSQGQALEGALWAGLRSLEERADLFRRLSRKGLQEERLQQRARAADEHATVLRSLITAFGREPGTAGELGREGDD